MRGFTGVDEQVPNDIMPPIGSKVKNPRASLSHLRELVQQQPVIFARNTPNPPFMASTLFCLKKSACWSKHTDGDSESGKVANV
jgi:hypothetical protein